MTGSNDYISFVMSRMLAGLFGSISPILATGFIMDLYFLHQRGKAFTVLEVSLLAGALTAPVFGGFIADTKPWPNVFWWLVALIAVSIPLGMTYSNLSLTRLLTVFSILCLGRDRLLKGRRVRDPSSAPKFIHVK